MTIVCIHQFQLIKNIVTQEKDLIIAVSNLRSMNLKSEISQNQIKMKDQYS